MSKPAAEKWSRDSRAPTGAMAPSTCLPPWKWRPASSAGRSLREIHVILGNLNTHKKNDAWLAAHPSVTFHFTPTSASWLNQVEIWFGIFQRKTLRNARFSSVDQLVEAIEKFTAAYNQNAAPFAWRKREVKGAQLRNTIVNLYN